MKRRALVTGASHGIGRAVAEMLLSEGWFVMGVSRTDLEIDRVVWWKANVAEYAEVEPLRHCLFDAVIHCAAEQGPVGALQTSSPREWRQAVETNLIGTYNVVRAALPALLTASDGRILLFSGGGAFNARPGYSAYAASKAGVVSLMETLAAELRDTDVTVNCVSPGFVHTGFDPHAAALPFDPDGSRAMARAVACVRHLLDPATRGLTGRTISAEFDDWENLSGLDRVRAVNDSTMGTRHRVPIQRVAAGVLV